MANATWNCSLFLAEHGFAVAYSDHLGHGMTAAHERDLGFIAKHDGYQKMIDDFYGCYSLLKRRFPEQKHFVMGHSMGSFIVRCFLCCYPGLASGAIIMGTGAKNPGAAPGRFLAKMTVKAKGNDIVVKCWNILFLVPITGGSEILLAIGHGFAATITS